MVKHLTTQRVTEPTVYVTKGRQRVKQYGNTIYLKNGDEFELELFNPTSNKVLAKITLNGKSLGAGMVLRPGERVFLERYFDEARKFLFETYEVDGGDYNTQQAIKLNGIVEVEFYNEHVYVHYHNTITYTPVVHTTWQPDYYFYSGNIGTTSRGVKYGGSSSTLTASANSCQSKSYVDGPVADSNIFSCSTASMGLGTATPTSTLNINATADFESMSLLETGRVEKGSVSDQGFVNDSTSFNSYYSWKTTWKILPESQRPVMKEDLNVYCTSCGAKRKKATHKFCPNCGGKF